MCRNFGIRSKRFVRIIECFLSSTFVAFDVYIDLVKRHIDAFCNRCALATRLASVDDTLILLEKGLTNDVLKTTVNQMYSARVSQDREHKGCETKFYKFQPKLCHGITIGLVEHYSTFLTRLVNASIFPLVTLSQQLQSRLGKYKKEVNDIYEALELFCDIWQTIEDFKVDDLVWITVIAHFAGLSPRVRTTESLDRWPKLLRNAKAHGQVKIVGYAVHAYNCTAREKDFSPNFELSVEVRCY